MFNPYIILIAGAAFLSACGYSYWAGHSRATESCDAAKYKSQVDSLSTELLRERLASKSAADARNKMEADNAELEKQLAEFSSKQPPPAPSCINRDAARRLRGKS
jgi:hypothetical protein